MHSKIRDIFKISKKAIFTEIAVTLEVLLVSPSNFGIQCIITLLTHTIRKKLKKSYKIEVTLENIVLS